MASARRRLGLLHHHLEPAEAAEDAAEIASTPLEPAHCRAAAAAAVGGGGAPVVIGGMVMDLQAHPSGPADVQRGGSVPGRVRQSAGGVARNVAEALALLLKSAQHGLADSMEPSSSSSESSEDGGPAASPSARLPLLVSAVGDDLAGRALLQHWQSLGLSAACIARLPGGVTPTVSVVFDLGGEVAACVADVLLLERALTPRLLRQPPVRQALGAAPVVMLDGNLGEAALEEACRLAAAAGVPAWFEPVSVPKSVRATRVLGLLAYVSPNEKELAAMSAAARRHRQQQGVQQHGQQGEQQQGPGSCRHPGGGGGEDGGPSAALLGMLPDVATLLLAGVQHIVLTLGADGAALCTLAPGRRAVSVVHLPALPAAVVNCSGAGDCLVAGCLFGLSRGLAPEAALAHGVAAAQAAVQSQSNVPPELSAAAVGRGAVGVLGQRRQWQLQLPDESSC